MSKDLWSTKGCSATIKHAFLVNSTVTNLKDKNYDYKRLAIKAKGCLEDQILKIKSQRQTNIDTSHSPKSLDLSAECVPISNVDICLWNQSYYYGIIPTSIGTDSSCVKIGTSVTRRIRGYKPTSKYPTHRSTITKLRNRCIQTNRSRSVSKLFKISRQQVRRLGVKGSLTGCTKSTW
jgi:ribosomal protein S14